MRKNFGAKPYLYPQPVMIIGTYDENGNANAMNAAWGGMAGANKIMIDLSSHKTTDNIQLNRAFTVSVGDVKHLTACDYVGMVSAHNAPDKMEKAGFTTTKSDFVNAPIINELPLTLECELLDVIEGSLYLGEIKNVSMQVVRLRMWGPCRTAFLMHWNFPARSTTLLRSSTAPAHRPPAKIWHGPLPLSLPMRRNWK